MGGSDLDQRPVDCAEGLIEIMGGDQASDLVDDLPDDLVFGDIPGELGEPAIGPMAEDVVEPHIVPGRDPSPHRGQILFPFLVGAVEPVADPRGHKFGEIADDELEDLVDLLKRGDFIPEARFEIKRHRQHVKEIADPNLRLAFESSAGGQDHDPDA